MELRHIRYFLAVAEERNFTRAAAKLGIGQPPLSLQIKDLEKEVGAKLFHRLAHGAELTEAGQAFFDAVRPIPSSAADAVRAARRASLGETGELNLGFTGTAALNPIVPAAIRSFRRSYPDAELRLDEANTAALVKGLNEGRLDAAILRPAEPPPEGLRIVKLALEPLVAVLPALLAATLGQGDIDLILLKNTPLILTPRVIGTSLHDAALQACRNAGFEPKAGQLAPQIASLMSLVSAELGFALVPASMRQLKVKGVAYRNIQGPAPLVSLAVAHRLDRPSALARNFAQTARKVAQTA